MEQALSCAVLSQGTLPVPRLGTWSTPASGCGGGKPGSWLGKGLSTEVPGKHSVYWNNASTSNCLLLVSFWEGMLSHRQHPEHITDCFCRDVCLRIQHCLCTVSIHSTGLPRLYSVCFWGARCPHVVCALHSTHMQSCTAHILCHTGHQRSLGWREVGRHHSPFFLLSAAEQFLVHRAAAHRTQQITVIIVISEHFESASLLILSCWLSTAIIAEPHHIRECRDAAVGRERAGRRVPMSHMLQA